MAQQIKKKPNRSINSRRMTEKKVENERRAMRFHVLLCMGHACALLRYQFDYILFRSILYHNTLWIAHRTRSAMELN